MLFLHMALQGLAHVSSCAILLVSITGMSITMILYPKFHLRLWDTSIMGICATLTSMATSVRCLGGRDLKMVGEVVWLLGKRGNHLTVHEIMGKALLDAHNWHHAQRFAREIRERVGAGTLEAYAATF